MYNLVRLLAWCHPLSVKQMWWHGWLISYCNRTDSYTSLTSNRYSLRLPWRDKENCSELSVSLKVTSDSCTCRVTHAMIRCSYWEYTLRMWNMRWWDWLHTLVAKTELARAIFTCERSHDLNHDNDWQRTIGQCNCMLHAWKLLATVTRIWQAVLMR